MRCSSRTMPRDERHEVLGFPRVQPAAGLVQHEKPRRGGQRARNLQHPLPAVGDVARKLAAQLPQATCFRRRLRRLDDVRVPPSPAARCRTGTPRAPRVVRQCSPAMTFSRQVRLEKRRMFWNVRAIPCCTIRCGFLPGDVVPLEEHRAAAPAGRCR